jgi:modulator of FtsH protease
MEAAYEPDAWHDFGVALVGASAALLGLLFLVVSIHLRVVVEDPVLRRRAEIMLGLLATTFAASAALLIPGQGRQALGIELMPIALVYITLSTLATFRATRSRQGVSRDRLARFLFGELSAGLIFAGGLGLFVRSRRCLSGGSGHRPRCAQRDARDLDAVRRPRVRAAPDAETLDGGPLPITAGRHTRPVDRENGCSMAVAADEQSRRLAEH